MMQQTNLLVSRSGALRATHLGPRLLRCPASASIKRSLRIQAIKQYTFTELPSAPPLRDESEDCERLPHQRSVGLEASTSQPSRDATQTNHSASPDADWNLGWLLEPKHTLLLGGLLGGLGMDMSKPGSVLQAITVLAVIVAVHEAGHFLAARLQGIRVTRFAVGFGPTLWKYQGPEVEYCLNAIPLGGYVAFPDDEMLPPPTPTNKNNTTNNSNTSTTVTPAASASTASASTASAPDAAQPTQPPAKPAIQPDDPDLLKNRPIGQRALVISAGVIANVLFAYLLLLAQISTVGKAETAFLPGVRVSVPDTPAAALSAAARAGLRSGDVILSVGDVAVPAAPSQVSTSVAAIRNAAGKEVELTVRRGGGGGSEAAAGAGGEVLTLRCTPDAGSDGQGRIGVQLSANTFIRHTYARDAGEVLAMTQSEFNRLSGTVFGGLKQIFTNFAAMSGQLSGPVAIVASGSEVLRADSAGLFQFAAIVNINLAAVNILPLPALDGGYLALLALEALRGGRKLPAGVEQGVMASGFLLLTALGLGLVIRDTINLL